jgi:hypothetical protein|uniref:Uncharacterized protein n=1 Tax=Oryza nivara TaxID=4536 RepID=A0A0E0G0X4_ORYNI
MKDFTSSDLSQFHTTKNYYYYLTSRLLHYFFHVSSTAMVAAAYANQIRGAGKEPIPSQVK